MKLLHSKPIYVFLLALFFCLHGAAENFGFISVKEVIEIFLVVFIIISSAFVLFNLFCSSALYAGFVVFLLASIYLFFGAIKANITQVSFLNSYTFLMPSIFISVVLIILFVRKKIALLYKLTFFLNLLFIIYCLFDLFTIVKKQLLLPKTKYVNSIGFDTKKVEKKPNIYFLLFDEYAGYTSLNDSFNFKNDIFYEQLKKDRFEMIPIHSNYSITQFSMASLFNMHLIKEIKDSSSAGWQQTQQRMIEIKYGEVFDVFKSMDYDVKSFSLFEVGENKSIGANQYLLGHKRVLTNKILHNVLLKDFGWKMNSFKFTKNIYQKIIIDDLPNYNEKVETGLFSNINKSTKPQFLYTHFLMPHFPYLFDSNGIRKPLSAQFEMDCYTKINYLSYLKYCNKKIIEYEQTIIKKDSSAVIVLMSDHGFRDPKVNLFPSAFNNFCAIRNLSQQLVKPENEISNVNFFRFLFNQNFNQQIPFCKDSIIVLKELE